MNKHFRQKLTLITMTALLAMPLTTMAADYDNHWAKSAITKWSNHQIVKGYEDGTFKPSNNINRAELASILSRLMGLTEMTGATQYTDVPSNAWYAESVAKVSALDILYTPGKKFEATKLVTREEAAYAIAMAYQIESTHEEVTIKDSKQISPWAKAKVEAMVQKGYIKGYEDGTFRPQAPITRAEIVTILDNISPNYITAPGTYTEDLKGNVIINTPGVILQDMKIEGDLYLTAALGEQMTELNQVEVTGTIYIQGGQTQLSGKFNRIKINTTSSTVFKQGTAEEIDIISEGANVHLKADTQTAYLVVYAKANIKEEGIIKKRFSLVEEGLRLESAGVYIDETFVPIDIKGDTMIIDLPKLRAAHPNNDVMDALIINSNVPGAYLEGYSGGVFKTNTIYTFRKANMETGILDEMLDQILGMSKDLSNLADSLGITGESAFDLLGSDSSVSISHLINQFNMAANLVHSQIGVEVADQYEFTRTLHAPNQEPITIKIKVIVNS